MLERIFEEVLISAPLSFQVMLASLDRVSEEEIRVLIDEPQGSKF